MFTCVAFEGTSSPRIVVVPCDALEPFWVMTSVQVSPATTLVAPVRLTSAAVTVRDHLPSICFGGGEAAAVEARTSAATAVAIRVFISGRRYAASCPAPSYRRDDP